MVNGKKYIGQITKTCFEQFDGHIVAAFEHNADFKLSRALRKYGIENFSIETLKKCSSKNELNFFEKYFIQKYEILKNGYNMTVGGEGGDTYCELPQTKLQQIKAKISLANSFGNNDNAHHFYMKNISTNEVNRFGSFTECKKWFFDNLNMNIERPGSTNLKDAESFGFQVPLFGKYIFSDTEIFSPYTFSKKVPGSMRWRVNDENGNFVYGANNTTDFLSHFEWTQRTFLKRAKELHYIITCFGGRKTNEKSRIME